MSFTRSKRPVFSSSLEGVENDKVYPSNPSCYSTQWSIFIWDTQLQLYNTFAKELPCLSAPLLLTVLTLTCFKRSVSWSWPRFVENMLILQDFSFTFAETKKTKTTHSNHTANCCSDVPGWHIILGQQWNLQHFGAGNDDLLAGGGHGLAGDAVHLVEGVGPQVAIVGRADEHLQVHRLLAVPQQLREGTGNRNRLGDPTASMCAHCKHTMSPQS